MHTIVCTLHTNASFFPPKAHKNTGEAYRESFNQSHLPAACLYNTDAENLKTLQKFFKIPTN